MSFNDYWKKRRLGAEKRGWRGISDMLVNIQIWTPSVEMCSRVWMSGN